MADLSLFNELSNECSAAHERSIFREKMYHNAYKDLEEWLLTHLCWKSLREIRYPAENGYYILKYVPIDPHSVQFLSVSVYDKVYKELTDEIEAYRQLYYTAHDKYFKADKQLTEYVKTLTREEKQELKRDMIRQYYKYS